jgi:diguanylate cyclase (GGDEF)-like protein
MFLDVDRFKRVNDSLGHELGDELLRTLAARLGATIRGGDTVSRFGGDEFLILCPDVEGELEALALADRLHAAASEPIALAGRDVHMTACIGIALADGPLAEAGAETLIGSADTAMYRAKLTAGLHTQVFDEQLHHGAVHRLETEVALRAAIGRDELTLHYQPIVELPGGEIRGAEALVRWNRPGSGLTSPLEFIDLAEESGLIVPIGEWVFGRAARDLADWRRQGLMPDDFTLSVNVSPRQLVSANLADTFRDLLERTGCPANAICIEITESALIANLDQAHMALRALKRVGLQVAIDDFGTGYSSLAYVANLPIDELKLDRSFIERLDSERDLAIVSTISSLAKALGVAGVAEGIESEEQAAKATELGYALGQGYLFARPEPESAFRSRLLDELTARRSIPRVAS